ncbi:tail protein X [Sulfurimonas sp.]|uniref:tail protein X n=1 Tax=Sulfurimonas sp. TaxID=2022749 RepID=UPI0025FE7AAC|nr:tail protein X [Sulfurimonas sp.]
MKTYIAQSGDRLDTIINNTYKTLEKQVIEKVFEANPHLATAPVLSDGDIVNLPVIVLPKEQIKKAKTLWE